MKKIISVTFLLVLGMTSVSFASIDKNLKYGQRDKEVTELQEFLIDKGFLKTAPSTFFGLLTLKAVKAYQKSASLSSTGYVGLLTRQKINDELALETETSNQAEIQETGTTTSPPTTKEKVTIVTQQANDYCKNIEGLQTNVPTGMYLDSNGNCFTNVVTQPVTTQPITNSPTQSSNQNSAQTQQTSTVTIKTSPTCTLSAETVTVSGELQAKISWTSQNATGGSLSILRDGLNPAGANLDPVSGGSISSLQALTLARTEGSNNKFIATFGGLGGEVKCETSLATTYPITVPTISISSVSPISPLTLSSYPMGVFVVRGSNFNDANHYVWNDIDYSVVSEDFTKSDIRVSNGGVGDMAIQGGSGDPSFIIKTPHTGKLKIVINSATFMNVGGKIVNALGVPLESNVIEIK